MQADDTTRRVDELIAENAELRRRVESAEAEIATLRQESQARAAEVRRLVQDVPVTLSRWAVLRSLGGNVLRHPDKVGVLRAGGRKLARAPRRMWRSATGS